MLREFGYYGRMAWGMRELVRTLPPPDWEDQLRAQLRNRETIFLDTVRKIIFSKPEHPYNRMFQLAGCTYGDLANAVMRDGLEATLSALRKGGVYLAHDEFKGKTPIVRSGEHIRTSERSFLNPLATGLIETTSGGSRSSGTRTRHNTRDRLHREAYFRLRGREFELGDRAQIEVKPILPSGSGLLRCVRARALGYPIERWFTVGGAWGRSGHYRIMTHVMVALANLFGAGAPWPVCLPLNDFSPVARWAARRRAEGVACMVGSFTSAGVRVAAAAAEAGLDISGTLFLVGGEALTDSKRAVIERAGAQVYPSYWIHEVGPVGHACRRMNTGNCVHLFEDSVAVIGYRRKAPLSDTEVNSLLFTSLLPFAPRILINAEMDDSGVIEEVRCDCEFSRLGYNTRIRDIFSFGKLTGQGMTLVGTDLLKLLEEEMPARFGGKPGDYQLVECEGAAQTQLTLRVSPRTGVTRLEPVREHFLTAIRPLYGGALATRSWRHAGAVEVVLEEPVVSPSGKILPLHLLGSGVRRSDEA
jgi:hypothetical protein